MAGAFVARNDNLVTVHSTENKIVREAAFVVDSAAPRLFYAMSTSTTRGAEGDGVSAPASAGAAPPGTGSESRVRGSEPRDRG